MVEISIFNATGCHIRALAKHLRNEDRREIENFGFSVNRALWRSFKGSIICKSIFVDSELAAIFGLGGNMLCDTGAPWLLTTDAVRKVSPLKFSRIYQQQVEKMLELFPVLENYVDPDYSSSVRMLENIGFGLGELEEIGKNKALFRKFRITA